VPKQLPKVALGWRGNPDAGKAFYQQEIENECSIPLIGLLFAHFAGADLRGVTDPQFVAEIREQTFEPVHRPRGFNAHAHRFLRTSQAPVESVGLAVGVIQNDAPLATQRFLP
jgi:hypothetical protein